MFKTQIRNINELEYKLLMEIGLDIDTEHRLVDQDFGTFVFFNGKHIKAKRNGIEPFINKHTVYFDPVGNVKFMRQLFQYYINKINQLDGVYFPVFFPIFNQENRTGCIEMKNEEGSFRSEYYHNETLRYIDMIFRISGEILDLRQFDFVVE